MQKKIIFFSCVVFITLSFNISAQGYAKDQIVSAKELNNPIPENTVLLANEMDVRFSQDFSVLLKHLRLAWIVLSQPTIPSSVQDKHIILLGHPDAAISGKVMRGILTEDEITGLRNSSDQYILLEKESLWTAGNTIYICSGADPILIRNCAETLLRRLMGDAPPAVDWIRATYDFEVNDGFIESISQLQFDWEDTELPLDDLMINVDAKPARRISSEQAAEDVDRLFYLLSHGYAGYAFFNQDEAFEQARMNILVELSSKSIWSKQDLSDLIYEHLKFITDCHLSIEDYRFAEHEDFWYDTQLELVPGVDGYQFSKGDSIYTVISINGGDPVPYLYPSLNQAGEPIYRIGVLSSEKPESVELITRDDEGDHTFEIKLQRSSFESYTEEIFSEDVLGGIPVVRARSFGDSYPEELNKFVKTANNLRGEPVVILDIRGNGGGNESWPVSWIQGLTGRRAEAVFATSELESKTSIAGRANAFIYWESIVSDPTLFSSQAKLYTQRAERFEVGQRQPGWTEVKFPRNDLISNKTTVVMITNNSVASAGEGLVMRLSQAENVIVVGENTMGCLTFGNISLHQLPHSKLQVWTPINFCLFSDSEFREGVGLAPDLWVPAKDAVNFTVAAIRRGTITTYQPLTEQALAQDFKPESSWRKNFQMDRKSWLVIGAFTLGGAVWAYALRKKALVLVIMGVGWLGFGIYWLTHRSERSIGYGYFVIGMIWLVWGGINLFRGRPAIKNSD